MTEQPQMNIATLWEICIAFLWDQTLVESIDQLLRQSGTKSILDVAGGTGFPSLDLKKRDWDITYADGSPTMFALCQRKLKKAGLSMPCYLADWRGLTAKIPQRFDTLLCRGNSLPYVDSWDQPLTNLAPESIQKALEQFYQMLNPGGLLYVDTAGQQEFDQPAYPATWNLGQKEINGQQVSLKWSTNLDYGRKVRTWATTVVVDGRSHQFSHDGYLLTPDELRERLKQAGFQDISLVKVPGENWYDVFIGRKSSYL